MSYKSKANNDSPIEENLNKKSSKKNKEIQLSNILETIPKTFKDALQQKMDIAAGDIAYYVREDGLSFMQAVARVKKESTLGIDSWKNIITKAKSKLGEI